MQTKLPTIDWDLTLDTILHGNCILFLGPEVFTTADGKTLDEQLLDYIGAKEDPEVKVYQDGLFFFRMKQKRTQTYLKIRRFFQESSFASTNQLFQKIARIPFHCILTVTPDNQLSNTFKELKIRHKTGFYWKKRAAGQSAPLPSMQVPLLYDMLGSIEKPESLVLTHDDLYDYLESIFQGQGLSAKLRDHIINEAQSIIFLGLPFDRWYMQLLLRVLHLHKDEEFMRFAASQELSSDIKTLCKEQFEINFVPYNINSFIDELYQRCEQLGQLRNLSEGQDSYIQQLRKLIAKDQLEETFLRFQEWLESIGTQGQKLLDDIVLIASRHRRLKRKITQGIISPVDSDVELNKIRIHLLDLLDKAQPLE